MIAAVAFSGFVALSLAPMLCSKLLRRTKRGRIAAWVDERFQRLEASYTRGLGRVLARPLLPLSLVVLRSEEHTSELQSLMRISYAVFCLKKKTTIKTHETQEEIEK